MTTAYDIHNIIDTMYNTRSEFRSKYTKLPAGIISSIETKLIKSITSSVGEKIKVGVEIDLTEFTITVIFESEDIAKKKKNAVESAVDGVLRSFLEKEYLSNESIITYIENPANKLMDTFIVGESVKFII